MSLVNKSATLEVNNATSNVRNEGNQEALMRKSALPTPSKGNTIQNSLNLTDEDKQGVETQLQNYITEVSKHNSELKNIYSIGEKDKHIKNAIEVGWRLKKKHWGNGYATEVGLSLVKKAKELNKKVVARAMIDNRASIRVMEKIGLKFIEEFWGDYEPHSKTPDVRYELP